jgi:hypothetical protein
MTETSTSANEKKTKKASGWQMPPFREWVAATLALVIVVGAVTLVVMAAQSTTGEGTSYDRLKDLLLFINPLIGVVIGYYFNKATSEGRAENAEQVAQSASETMQSAIQIRDEAVSQASEAVDALEDVTQCANDMMSIQEQPAAPGTGPGTLSLEGMPSSTPAVSEEQMRSRLRMQAALEKAQRVLKK